MQHKDTQGRASVKFHFQNIGPAKNANMEFGDLTIIAGQNNTGKTYLAYTLYGFLKMWKDRLRTKFWQKERERSVGMPDMEEIHKQLERESSASFAIDKNMLENQRAAVIRELSRDFSESALSNIFNSQKDDFKGAQVDVLYEGHGHDTILPSSAKFELSRAASLTIKWDAERIVMTIYKRTSRPLTLDWDFRVSLHYMEFLLRDLFPTPFILSSERFGISLFYRELDFTKNQLVDMLQKMGDDKNQKGIFPFLFIDKATSRYALPIKDNIDYTRSILDLKKDKSEFREFHESKLFDDIKDMMNGYYSVSNDEIRFKSKERKQRRFDIPLHLASSSVRGLSDLYFFLRYVADPNHLLIIDEPESHLDTRNQIKLAQLLSRIIQTGLKVLITTHSDYLVKELNNLIMLDQEFEGKDIVLKKLHYTKEDALPAASIRAYVAEEGGLTRCKVDKFGIDMPVFDATINNINTAANELVSRLKQEEEA